MIVTTCLRAMFHVKHPGFASRGQVVLRLQNGDTNLYCIGIVKPL